MMTFLISMLIMSALDLLAYLAGQTNNGFLNYFASQKKTLDLYGFIFAIISIIAKDNHPIAFAVVYVLAGIISVIASCVSDDERVMPITYWLIVIIYIIGTR